MYHTDQSSYVLFNVSLTFFTTVLHFNS